jgi:hypothetical protein
MANTQSVGSRLLYSPMIKVSVSKLRPVDGVAASFDLIAMVDTGSDYCRIDIGVATRLNLEVLTQGESSHHFDEHVTSNFYGAWTIFEDKTVLPLTCLGIQLKDDHYLFDMLIGMAALQHFETIVAPQTETVTLRFVR